MNTKVYDLITDHIISLLEAGVCPWRKPWHLLPSLPPQNFASGKAYRGINLFLLSTVGFETPYFLTFRQVTERGGHVKKGCKGVPVIYWSLLDSKKRDAKGNPEKIPFLRYYTVFNATQIENVAFPSLSSRGEAFQPLEAAETVVTNWQGHPEILHGFRQASYLPGLDLIHMPNRQNFDSPAGYYSTLFHELGHSTGAPHRLNRVMTGSFGGEAYGREELVAEMTAAFLCAHCAMDNSVTHQQAAYLDHWLKALKEDSKLVVHAATQAQKAAHLILGITPETADTPPVE